MADAVLPTPDEIEVAYSKSGNTLGWRLLGSPAHVMEDAEIAFIGLNPGGNHEPSDHPRFAPSNGSIYVQEGWGGSPPGQSPLQLQVRALFDALSTKPEDVLAGNLVPFRSPNFDALRNPRHALKYGTALWMRILGVARPRLIVTMGGSVERAVTAALRARQRQKVPLGWGLVTGRNWDFADGTIVALPHLSRYRVVERPASQDGLATLFKKWWTKA